MGERRERGLGWGYQGSVKGDWSINHICVCTLNDICVCVWGVVRGGCEGAPKGSAEDICLVSEPVESVEGVSNENRKTGKGKQH